MLKWYNDENNANFKWLNGDFLIMEKKYISKKSTQLRISVKALKKIAWCAANEVEGVVKIYTNQNFLEKYKNIFKPTSEVSLEFKDGVVDVTLFLCIKENFNLLDVCEKIQENVKKSFQNISTISVGRVNVFVEDISIEQE